MRYRIWAVIGVVLLAVALSSCTTSRVARGPVTTPVPTKTLRPTFTHTPAKPTMTAAPTAVPATATPEAPAATPEPPTEVPSPTSEVSRLTANAAVNVRSGPGTNYPQIGRLQAGQSFAITGKNPAGDWWQFDFNGRSGWVLGELVRASGGERVQVAANIAPPPTARPRPTARPVARTHNRSRSRSRSRLLRPACSLRTAPIPNAEEPNFQWVTFWGRLGKLHRARTGWIPSPGQCAVRLQRYRSTRCGSAHTPVMPSEFMYNAKAELPRAGGAFRAVVIDGAGNEVSDAISGTLLDRTHDVILFYAKR